MPWHRDPFHRVAVVLSGDVLSIEYRDGGESQRIQITAGQVEWEEPSARVHRAVNVGKRPYEQVTVFLLDQPNTIALPFDGGVDGRTRAARIKVGLSHRATAPKHP